MKILITSPVDLRKLPPQRPHYFIKHLSKNHEVTVLCATCAHWQQNFTDDAIGETLGNAKLYYLCKSGFPPLLQKLCSVFRTKGRLNSLGKSSFDIHFNMGSLFCGYIITKELSKLGVLSVFDLYDDFPKRLSALKYVPFFLQSLLERICTYMLSKTIKLSGGLSCVTKSLGESYAVTPAKMCILPNGINTELTSLRIKAVSKNSWESDGFFVLGFIGILNPWVNLKPALEALKKLACKGFRVKLVICGDGPKLNEIRETIKKLGIMEHVVVTGFIPSSEIPSHIKSFNACLICLQDCQDCNNAFPLKLFEYLACGKPVISTPLKGVKEAGMKGVIYAKSSEEIEIAAERLIADESSDIYRFAKEDAQVIKENYSWDSLSMRLEDLLKDTFLKAKESAQA